MGKLKGKDSMPCPNAHRPHWWQYQDSWEYSHTTWFFLLVSISLSSPHSFLPIPVLVPTLFGRPSPPPSYPLLRYKLKVYPAKKKKKRPHSWCSLTIFAVPAQAHFHHVHVAFASQSEAPWGQVQYLGQRCMSQKNSETPVRHAAARTIHKVRTHVILSWNGKGIFMCPIF
jgi:hypothetical protein